MDSSVKWQSDTLSMCPTQSSCCIFSDRRSKLGEIRSDEIVPFDLFDFATRDLNESSQVAFRTRFKRTECLKNPIWLAYVSLASPLCYFFLRVQRGDKKGLLVVAIQTNRLLLLRLLSHR